MENSESRAIPATPAERVDFIVDIMERLRWERGKTAKRLAAEWGVSVSTVENYSAEASRRVTADADEAKRDITAGCRKLFRNAVNQDDAKAAKAVGELWASVSGAKAAEKHEVSGTVATPAAAAALVRQKFGEHASKSDPDPGEAPSTPAPVRGGASGE